MTALVKTLINVPEEDLGILDGFAAEKGVPRTAVTRWAIRFYIEQKILPSRLFKKTNDLEEINDDTPLTVGNLRLILQQALAEHTA